MADRLRSSVSPYLLSHADNPVDWFPWGEEAFAEAERRGVPVLVSIGYATCHWCHVMARESFSDPLLAAELNARFVAVKVDREEHPDVDTSYLAAASAFTQNLGWPLTVFTTPSGEPFYAGTYFPPVAVSGAPAFRDVLAAVTEAWTDRHEQVVQTATAVADAVRSASTPRGSSTLPNDAELDAAVEALAAMEDPDFGGFGGAPKFPVAPVLGFLAGRDAGRGLARRTLAAIAASPLRDEDGGIFRYATRRDWSEPHYERMLYDNAQLLDIAVTLGDEATAHGIAGFLLATLQQPSGGFASAQDSESEIDGRRVEGDYYLRTLADRDLLRPPAVDEKVLTGWNGLAIGALARAGRIGAAREAADFLLARHVQNGQVTVRASLGGAISSARPALEDIGMLAGGLLDLALASGDVRYAVSARALVDGALAAGEPFGVPGGGDATLGARGLLLASDPSEGAYPSGASALGHASETLFLLTGERRYRETATAVVGAVDMLTHPLGFGAVLALATRLARPVTQLVVVAPDAAALRPRAKPSDRSVVAIVTGDEAQAFADAGFELFDGRGVRGGTATVYACQDFVCALPTVELPEDVFG
ncbi:thioredoxin domain-containing protein [Microbacteriaceae bacterium VKM Ac-2855]|nr:thioredoxin domain-containing protein [Microbacteriaceae bacterium VKM Ac-2855]